MRKFQQKSTQEARQSALDAGVKSQEGFAKDIAEINEKLRKWTTFTDDKGVKHRVR